MSTDIVNQSTTQEVGVESSAVDNNSEVIGDNDHDHHHHHHHDHKHHGNDGDVLRDLIMWKRKEKSAAVELVSTAVWVLLKVYGFNFLPLVCWTLMAFVTLLFLYGSLLRLFRKEASCMRSWEMRVTEERGKEMGERAKKMIEQGIRWMFYVSCEKEWYIFLGVISTLFLLAYVGSFIDLITLSYTGIIMIMSIPAIYVKKEDVIKAYGNKMKEQGLRMYDMVVSSTFNFHRRVRKGNKEN